MLKLSDNNNNIEDEIKQGQFGLSMSDHILHSSFIDKNQCTSVMNSLDNLERMIQPYTDGLLNDDADTYFDPDIKYIDNVEIEYL